MFHLLDGRVVALVERPLLDPFAANEARTRQDLQMLAGGGLTNAQLLRDQQAANTIVDEVAIDLRRKMFGRSFQPLQNLKSLVVTERAKRVLKLHIDT